MRFFTPHICFTIKTQKSLSMDNQQVSPLPFLEECWRHRFNRDLIQEDQEEFKEEEMKKCQSEIIKELFGKDPKVQSWYLKEQGSSATSIGRNVDFLAMNLWPKIEKGELLKLLSVSKI